MCVKRYRTVSLAHSHVTYIPNVLFGKDNLFFNKLRMRKGLDNGYNVCVIEVRILWILEGNNIRDRTVNVMPKISNLPFIFSLLIYTFPYIMEWCLFSHEPHYDI